MEVRRQKISRNKTVYLTFNGDGNLDGNSDINLQGENLGRIRDLIHLNILERHWQRM